MHNSIIYSSDTMSISQWFNMLANQGPVPKDDLDQKTEESSVATYVCFVETNDPFLFNGEIQAPGSYYARMSKEEAETLSNKCNVYKFSFSDIVLYSDIFSSCIQKSDEEMNELLQKGEAGEFFEKELDVTTQGIKTMREKVWTQYFDGGLMAIIRRVLSAIVNLFKKYNSFVNTGIYWPGNSCHYADQVAHQIHEFKKTFIRQAYELSKVVVKERLEISSDEFEELDFDDLKNLYRRKALQVHPDKNLSDPEAPEKFHKINGAWEDFIRLHRLKEKFNVELVSDEEILLEKEVLAEKKSVEVEKKSPEVAPLASHCFKVLALPAPLPVLVD